MARAAVRGGRVCGNAVKILAAHHCIYPFRMHTSTAKYSYFLMCHYLGASKPLLLYFLIIIMMNYVFRKKTKDLFCYFSPLKTDFSPLVSL